MATTYYADFDLTTGNNTGADAANAWKTMADVIAGSNGTAPAAGDTVLCKNTDTLSGVCSWTISGSYDGGYVKLIGVDASWANVGGSTRAVLDRAGGASICLSIAASYVWFENFEIKGAGTTGSAYHGVQFASGGYRDYNVFINCYSHNNRGNGFDGNGGYARYATLIRCRASENAVDGFVALKDTSCCFCRSDNNTGRGFYPYGTVTSLLYGCISHDNGTDGIYNYFGAGLINCTSVENAGDGIGVNYINKFPMVGCRVTGNAIGLNNAANIRIPVFYYYGDNTTEMAGYYDEILNDGENTVTLNGTDTDEGFSDPTTNDYSLASDATYRREAIEIP